MPNNSIKYPKLIAWTTNEQLNRVKSAAREAGISVSDFIRIATFEKLKLMEGRDVEK